MLVVVLVVAPSAMVMLPPSARTSTVPPRVTMSPVAVCMRLPCASTVTAPLPPSTSAFSVMLPGWLDEARCAASSTGPLPWLSTASLTTSRPSCVLPLVMTMAPLLPAVAPASAAPPLVPPLLTTASTLPIVRPLPSATKMPPACASAASSMMAVSITLPAAPTPPSACTRSAPAATLTVCAPPAASASVTVPAVASCTVPVPAATWPSTMPVAATMRCAPLAVISRASAAISNWPAASSSRLCAVALACTRLPAPNSTSPADCSARLPLSEATVAVMRKSAPAASVRSWMSPAAPELTSDCPTTKSPSATVSDKAPPLPATLRPPLASSRPSASIRCKPPLVLLLALSRSTSVRSAALGSPMPVLAASRAVTVRRLAASPPRPSRSAPALLVTATLPPADTMDSVMSPTASSVTRRASAAPPPSDDTVLPSAIISAPPALRLTSPPAATTSAPSVMAPPAVSVIAPAPVGAMRPRPLVVMASVAVNVMLPAVVCSACASTMSAPAPAARMLRLPPPASVTGLLPAGSTTLPPSVLRLTAPDSVASSCASRSTVTLPSIWAAVKPGVSRAALTPSVMAPLPLFCTSRLCTSSDVNDTPCAALTLSVGVRSASPSRPSAPASIWRTLLVADTSVIESASIAFARLIRLTASSVSRSLPPRRSTAAESL